MDSGPPIFARRRSRSPLPFTPTTWRPTGDWAGAVHHGSGAGPVSGGGSGVCGAGGRAGGRLWNRLPGCHANRRACVNSGKLAGHTTAGPARRDERAPRRREPGGRRQSARARREGRGRRPRMGFRAAQPKAGFEPLLPAFWLVALLYLPASISPL